MIKYQKSQLTDIFSRAYFDTLKEISALNTERFKRTEYTKKRRAIAIAVFAVMMALFILSASTVYAATTGRVVSSIGINVRTGPGTSYSFLFSIDDGKTVEIIEDNVRGTDGAIWYKISYNGRTGYAHSSYISKTSAGSGTSAPADFKNKMKAAGFPDSYIDGLYEIYQEHPNWSFKAVKTGLDWDTVVDKESEIGISLVENSLSDVLKSVEKGAYNLSTGEYISYDSGNWVPTSEETVAYYLDPRNFLDKTNVFQFMSTKFDSSTQTLDMVEEVVAGTFLEKTKPDSLKTYAQVIFEAGRDNGVNPLVIAAMLIEEHGSADSALISGDVKGYEKLYNFFNINAYENGGKDAVENGLEYAKKQGWDTPEKSIRGGAEIYAANYVNSNKYTLYFQRFNVLNGLSAVGTGQYMTCIYGAQSEGAKLAQGYSGYADKSLTFEIPVYNNMPSSACAKPSGSGSNVNYLKTLSVEDGKITPEFDPYVTEYKIVVPDGTTSVNLKATAYDKASVSGAGTLSLKNGAKKTTVEVISTSGKVREYDVTVVTESFSGSFTADTDRISGANRFETAVSVAEQLKKELGVSRFANVVIANSDDFADALSATALAAEKKAPILIVNKNNEEYARTYIRENMSESGTVYIVGGTGVITTGFESSLSGYNVVRLAGENRYETNLAVLKAMNLNGRSEILTASGLDYADALSASATGKPVMLVGNGLTSSQSSFLKSLGSGQKCYILGGTAAVSETTENQIKSSVGGTVERVYGDNRFKTGRAIAEKFFKDADTVLIASGDDFPDGLTGGVLANAKGAPVLLVNKNNTVEAAGFVDEYVIQTVTAIGGTSVITADMLNKIA